MKTLLISEKSHHNHLGCKIEGEYSLLEYLFPEISSSSGCRVLLLGQHWLWRLFLSFTAVLMSLLFFSPRQPDGKQKKIGREAEVDEVEKGDGEDGVDGTYWGEFGRRRVVAQGTGRRSMMQGWKKDGGE
ncbi:hypothetical protein NE237_001289 [Protea cynaroides]|uniref:Transmembrane protein n=1 Tax=Protea cynaroides TaxID=273540 RepID=A0A9Q0QXZ6_9MAGN|nr:hypothetical protein NE237_001289 [Protea cynaroides]